MEIPPTITINQIKGAISGAIIGDNLARFPDDNFQRVIEDFSPCINIALTGIKSIVNSWEFNQKSWLMHIANDYPNYLKYKSNFNLAETAISLSPLICYSYDNERQLELDLEEGIKLWLKSEFNENVIKFWAFILTEILSKKINFHREFFIKIDSNDYNLTEEFSELKIIKEAILNQLTLTDLSSKFSQKIDPETRVIYQAIYFFISLPNDFYLSLRRSTNINYQPILTSTLTGFLLGLNNGYLAIPYKYRYHLESQTIYDQIEQLSFGLIETWTGQYLPNLKIQNHSNK
jgi:hypothetical protein